MAKAAARGAERACEIPSGQTELPWMVCGGYPAYINEYNLLVPFVIKHFGEEAERLFQPIDIGKAINPADAVGAMWRTYLELASARLNALTAYIQTKVGRTDFQIQSIIDLINTNLRPTIFEDPEKERDVQNALETLFRVRGIDYRREKITIPYSSKTFVPDFTFESLDLALEVKLCKSAENEKTIIDDINADIPAFQTKYKNVVFVVYDIGHIRDVSLFKSGIESNPDIYVQVIKR